MSINGSKKEFIYTLYLSKNRKIIEQSLRINIEEVELEKYIDSRRIDMFCSTKEDINVFVELQLSTADNVHFNQLIKIANSEYTGKNFILVWIATEFNEEILRKLLCEIEKTNKNIEFVAIILNKETFQLIEELNSTNEFEVIGRLGVLDKVDKQLMVYKRTYTLKNSSAYSEIYNIEVINDDVSKSCYNLLKDLLKEMRTQISYYLPIYRSKEFQGNKINLGAGAHDISYSIGINRYNYLFIELRFSNNQRSIYCNLLKEKEHIDDHFDYRLQWDNKFCKISTFILLQQDNSRQVKEAVRVLDKYIRHFSKYIFSNKIECEI